MLWTHEEKRPSACVRRGGAKSLCSLGFLCLLFGFGVLVGASGRLAGTSLDLLGASLYLIGASRHFIGDSPLLFGAPRCLTVASCGLTTHSRCIAVASR